MPRLRRWFPLALLPLLAACGEPPAPPAAPVPAPVAAPAKAAPVGTGEVVDGLRRFGAKRIMDIRLSMAATDAGAAREVVNRRAAGRIAARDPAAFAQAIATILSRRPDPAATMAAAEPFSWDRNARELRAHLAGLVADYSG